MTRSTYGAGVDGPFIHLRDMHHMPRILFPLLLIVGACSQPSLAAPLTSAERPPTVAAGFSLGLPSGINLSGSYAFGHSRLRLSGGYFGLVGGAQLGFTPFVSTDSVFSRSVAVVVGYFFADRYVFYATSPQITDHYEYAGLAIEFNLRQLFITPGVALFQSRGDTEVGLLFQVGCEFPLRRR